MRAPRSPHARRAASHPKLELFLQLHPARITLVSQVYSRNACSLDHVGDLPQALLDTLPENQGHPVRHRCAACAYLAGLNECREDIRRLVDAIASLRDENARLKGEHQ